MAVGLLSDHFLRGTMKSNSQERIIRWEMGCHGKSSHPYRYSQVSVSKAHVDNRLPSGQDTSSALLGAGSWEPYGSQCFSTSCFPERVGLGHLSPGSKELPLQRLLAPTHVPGQSAGTTGAGRVPVTHTINKKTIFYP